MKKVLIISYYFPPCNLTGANRTGSWAEYLHLSDYHPIIVTRSWNNVINTPEDVLRSSGSEPVTLEKENCTIHYVPYSAGMRDRLFTSKSIFGKSLSKILSLIKLITQNFSNRSIPYRNLFEFSSELLKKDKSIQKVLISGDPFIQFKFGYQLHKKFGIKWIADYRDGWSTQELETEKGLIYNLIKLMDRRNEKKWVGTASYITSVSDLYTTKISQFVKVEGETIFNGYFESDLHSGAKSPDTDVFTIAYSGSLYNSQKIEIFIEGYKQFINLKGDPIPCTLHFIGLKYDDRQSRRVESLMKGYENYVKISGRISREDSLDLLSRAHIHVISGYENHKGVPSSKIFDYIALNRPIILCPTDNDVIEQIVMETKKGMIANTAEEVCRDLQDHYASFLKRESVWTELNPSEYLAQYSRKNSTARLAQLLDHL